MSRIDEDGVTFTNLGGFVYVVEDGAGGCIGITRAQIEELIRAGTEDRIALRARWRAEIQARERS